MFMLIFIIAGRRELTVASSVRCWKEYHRAACRFTQQNWKTCGVLRTRIRVSGLCSFLFRRSQLVQPASWLRPR